MDMTMVGKFLAELRKQHGYSQEELGEKIGVTNKTISRWETGRYLPPADALEVLSNLYGITINELLAGRKLSEPEYRQSAEENIKTALNNSSFGLRERIAYFKSKWKKEHMTGLIVQVLCIFVIMAVGIIIGRGWLFFVGAAAGFVWSVVKYNQMMTYVENHAFDGNGMGEESIVNIGGKISSTVIMAGMLLLYIALALHGFELLSGTVFRILISVSVLTELIGYMLKLNDK